MPSSIRTTAIAVIALFLLILPTAATAQNVVADPASIIFTYKVAGPVPSARTIGVGLDTAGSAPYSASTQIGTWLTVEASTGMTPDTVTVTADPVGLAAGVYSDQVRITSGGSTTVIPVTLYVQVILTDLVIAPQRLFFEAQPAGPLPPAQIISASAFPGQQRNFSVFTSGDGWLLASPQNGLTPSSVQVLVDHRNLVAGTYQGSVNFLDSDGRLAVSVLVELIVANPSPVIAMPAAVSFQAESGVDAPKSQNVTITGISGESHLFESRAATDNGGDWLFVSPSAGITPMVIAVTVNAAGLHAGTYRGKVILSLLNRAVVIPVTLTVTGGPALSPSPSFLRFQSGGGIAPTPKSLAVDSLSGTPLSFVVATSGGNWLSVSPMSGTTLATLTVSASPAGLAPGVYNASIDLTAEGSAIPATVEVSFEVTGVTDLTAEPAALSFTAVAGAPSTVNKSISVGATGAALGFSVDVSSTGWLTATQTANGTPARVEVSMNPAGLLPGAYQGSVTLTAPAAGNSPVVIPVTLDVQGLTPTVSTVVHGASLTSGIVAAGTAVTIFGTSLGPDVGRGLEIGPDGKVATALAGVRVLFNGIPSPLIYVQNRQVNVIAPYGVAGLRSCNMVVEYNGLQSRPIQVMLSPAAPGIFTADSTGQGPGAILNQDYTLNSASNPAAGDQVVIIYGTGAGETDPPGVDGEVTGANPPRPVLPVRVWIGGIEARVEYAGGAPGLVAGVLQVNARIPQSLSPGTHPVSIEIGGTRSQLAVTVAVK